VADRRAEFDSVGLGLNAVDHMALVPNFPAAGGRTPMSEYVQAGGGQVATALCTQARLGLRVKYLGKVGDDQNGQWSLQNLRSHGVDVRDVITVKGETSQVAVILVVEGSGERTICWRRGPGLRFSATDFEGALTQGRYLHVDTHEIDRNILAAQAARERGMPVLIDAEATRPRVEELLPLCDIILADEGFAAAFTGEQTPVAMLKALRKKSGARQVGISQGARGAMLLTQAEILQAPAYPIKVVDTTGAGDVWHGAFGYGMLREWSPDRVLRFANATAALSCRGLGGRTALPRLEDVAQLMGECLDDLPPECEGCPLPSNALVEDAFAFAREAHRGQTRDEGTPYFAHPCRVARILGSELGVIDPELLASALLHDTLEDVPIDRSYFEARFGPTVSNVVLSLTRAPGVAKEDYLKGLSMASDDTLLVKMADRIDNLRQLHLSPHHGKAERYLDETRDYVLPLIKKVPRAADPFNHALAEARRASVRAGFS
jgi:sugar/nucleoside kinase (ribokinase family)